MFYLYQAARLADLQQLVQEMRANRQILHSNWEQAESEARRLDEIMMDRGWCPWPVNIHLHVKKVFTVPYHSYRESWRGRPPVWVQQSQHWQAGATQQQQQSPHTRNHSPGEAVAGGPGEGQWGWGLSLCLQYSVMSWPPPCWQSRGTATTRAWGSPHVLTKACFRYN